MGEFLTFLLVGFVAQLADGVLGMGFGVVSSSVLLAQGFSPPLVSASVNAAKIPTGAAAGLSHLLHGNVDRTLLARVAVAGCLGGVGGAILLSSLKGPLLTALVSVYLIGIGALILVRGVTGRAPRLMAGAPPSLIGAVGGTVEGIGGSWGPVVTSGLVGSGTEPRRAVGTSAVAEFAVSVTVFLALLVTHSLGHWGAQRDLVGVLLPVMGLIAGGVPAAMLGGWLAKRAPRGALAIGVGILAAGIGVYRLLPII